MKRLCCVLFLLLALAAPTLAASPATGQTAKPAPANPAKPAPAPAPVPAPAPAAQSIQDYRLDQLEKRLEKLPDELGGRLDQKAQGIERWAENTRKAVDSLLIMIGLIIGGFSLVGYFRLKNWQEEVSNAKKHLSEALEESRSEAEKNKQELEAILKSSQGMHRSIEDYKAKVERIVAKQSHEIGLPSAKQTGGRLTPTEQQEVRQMAQDPNAPLIPRLLALGLRAENEKDWKAGAAYWDVVIQQEPTNADAHLHLGFCLTQLATTDKEQAGHLWKRAAQHFTKATELNPNDTPAFSNWGAALGELAKISSGQVRKGLLEQALGKFAKAVELDPRYATAFYNWGSTLDNLAYESNREERKDILVQALEKFAQAAELNPDDTDILQNWSHALVNLAQESSGREQNDLFGQALDKYAQAAKLDPNDASIHFNNSAALLRMAHLETGTRREELLGQAEAAGRRAEELEPGSGAYNLACVCAKRNDASGCRKWLEKCQAVNDLPDCEHLKSDMDLDPVRQEPWFQEFLAKVCGPEKEQRSDREE